MEKYDFRNRAKKIPALANCSVIGMFQPWPKEVFFGVGKKFLSTVNLGSNAKRSVI